MKIRVISIALTLMMILSFMMMFTSCFKGNDRSETDNVYKQMIAISEIAKAYNSLEELVIDSDIVAFGKAKNVVGILGGRINSTFDFVISSVEKGNLKKNDIISVKFVGGKVLYRDYLIENREYFESTMPGFYDEEMELHGDEYIESFFYEVPNIKNGDQLVLFLSQTEYDDYYIVGSLRYGKFYYDKSKEEIYRILLLSCQEEENNVDEKEMVISIKEFKELIKSTKDISKP